MRIASICSAGGSAFFSLVDILIESGKYTPEDFLVITDRPCKAEEESRIRNITFHRIIAENQAFSQKTQEKLSFFNPKIVLLYFSRLVTSDIYSKHLTLNIHPSLLPAFKGFNAIQNAKYSGSKFLGATLHKVTELADSGEIVGQVIYPIQENLNDMLLQKISFIQKVYLGLCAVELAESEYFNSKSDRSITTNKFRNTWTSNPALTDKSYLFAFEKFQNKQGLEVVLP